MWGLHLAGAADGSWCVASQSGASVWSAQAPALPQLDPDAPQTDAPCPVVGQSRTQRGLPFPAPCQLELGQVPRLMLQII